MTKPQQTESMLQIGDYVLATKWHDGDPCDHFVVGFLKQILPYNPPRYDVCDSEGNSFRSNGFRRVEKITQQEGDYMLSQFEYLGNNPSAPSVWKMLQDYRDGYVSLEGVPGSGVLGAFKECKSLDSFPLISDEEAEALKASETTWQW
jgi:hypothetical protein